MVQVKQHVKIRERVVKQNGAYALHIFGAWTIYRNRARRLRPDATKSSWLLERLTSGWKKRATATPFVRWEEPAVIDAASCEADDQGGDDKSETTEDIAWDEGFWFSGGGGGG